MWLEKYLGISGISSFMRAVEGSKTLTPNVKRGSF
jgi:hypothetical protein